MKIKKSTLYLMGILFLIAISAYIMTKNNSQSQQNLVSGDSNGQIQKIVIGVRNLNYYPNTITVKSGIPVRIYLDESVSGCLRSFTIRDFGIAKYLKNPSDYVEFTPNKKGTFRFACSMGMGTGTLIVE